MRSAIHIYDAIHRAQVFQMERGELARNRIDLLRNPYRPERAPLIRRGMRTALEFRQTPFGMIVAVSLHPARIVQRNALIIPKRRTARPLIRIFRYPVRPDAGEIDLRECRHCQRNRKNQRSCGRYSHRAVTKISRARFITSHYSSTNALLPTPGIALPATPSPHFAPNSFCRDPICITMRACGSR